MTAMHEQKLAAWDEALAPGCIIDGKRAESAEFGIWEQSERSPRSSAGVLGKDEPLLSALSVQPSPLPYTDQYLHFVK